MNILKNVTKSKRYTCYFSILILFMLVITTGCNDKTEKPNDKTESNSDNVSERNQSDKSSDTSSVEIGELIENVTEYKEYVDQSKLLADESNYSDLERILKIVLIDNEIAIKKSSVGLYELEISSKETVLKYEGVIVDDDDPLYKALSDYCSWWRDNKLHAKIENPILTIKDGEVIRTSDPADYLKKD